VGDKPDWSKARSIQEMPVTSAVTGMQRKGTAEGGKMEVEGYAYSGGGREIVRVDVSMDGGETWEQAELMGDKGSGNREWWWKRWRFEGVPKAGKGKMGKVMVKATDESYNTQPESYGAIWNARGNLSCAWHGVEVGGEGKKDGEVKR
jgi:sulfite oxidase